VNIYLYLSIYLFIYVQYSTRDITSTRVVKNYSTPIWSRVLALLELLGTALETTNDRMNNVTEQWFIDLVITTHPFRPPASLTMHHIYDAVWTSPRVSSGRWIWRPPATTEQEN